MTFLRFQIPMDDAGAVRGIQRKAYLSE